MEKIKVGIVNYLNTKPLLYGIRQSEIMLQIELIPHYPAKLAQQLENGEIDLGLVPVAVIPQLNYAEIVGDYGIGCNGPVGSVMLFSQVPIEEVQTVLLDYQSRTSVALVQLLLTRYWKKYPEFLPAEPQFIDEIKGNTAALVIGDRCFENKKRFRYHYDLGEAWKAYTGLPFVFAAWVANKPLSPEFKTAFSKANADGVDQIEAVIANTPFAHYDMDHYYRVNIQYFLSTEARQGLQLFLDEIKREQLP